MSDEKDTRLKIGEHEVDHTGHPHAYAALEGMSEAMRNQVFHNAHNSEHGGLFTANVHGKPVEYRLSKHGEIHPVNHS